MVGVFGASVGVSMSSPGKGDLMVSSLVGRFGPGVVPLSDAEEHELAELEAGAEVELAECSSPAALVAEHSGRVEGSMGIGEPRGVRVVPWNAVTGAQYGGKNVQRLLMAEAEQGWETAGGWAGFKQWLSVGRVVRKGEHGTACITVIGRNGTESEMARSVTDSRESGAGGKKKGGGVRGFRVFHFDQTCELEAVTE